MTERRPDLILSLVGAASTLVVVLGLVVPGSVFEFPHSLPADEPISIVYSFPGGRLLVFLVFGLLYFLFLAALHVASRVPARRGAVVALLGSVVLGAAYVPMFPTGSNDLFHNIADARTLWVYGENPMTVPPSAHREDAVARHATAWADTPFYYGPATYLAYGIPQTIARDDLIANLLAFKAFNGLALVGTAGLAGYTAGSVFGKRRSEAILLVGWNPLLLYEAVGNGHNDVLMMLPAMASLILITRLATLRSSIALILSIGVKYFSVLLLPIVGRWLWMNEDRSGRLRLAALGLALAGVLVGYYLRFGGFLLTSPEFVPTRPPLRSPAAMLAFGLEPFLGSDSAAVARYVLWAVFAMLASIAALRLRPTPRSLYVMSFWVLLGAALLTVRQVYPWYLMWFIPLGALLPRSLEWHVAVLASVTGFLSYAFFPWH